MSTQGQFRELQQKLRTLWPSVTLRSIGDVERTVVVVHSISMDVPEHLVPVFPAYEERFLCLVLSLLRAPRSRVVYVTSQPILPRVVDYWFGLVPELDTPDARSRFSSVSLVDGRNVPLTRKLLARPRAVERVRRLVADPELAFVLPFATTPDEVELAVRLGLPLYGADPELDWLGTKSGSRRVFAEEVVPHPLGHDVEGSHDVVRALRSMRAVRPEVRGAVLKLDRGVSGLGNALVDVEAALTRDLRATLELEDLEQDIDEYLDALDREGGIVEERIEGTDFRSPSVQLRISPAGQVDIMSTHDQVLGGPHGQTYFGCRFPADQEYAARLALEGLKVGRRLAREGVIGRCAVDFVVVHGIDGEWQPYALEINLRCGGTTHPFFALQSLTDGAYDPLAGEFRTRHGDLKHYVATDHLDAPEYASLTPDDLLDVVAENGIGWDGESETGIALHMLSALAVAGRIGLTAVGDTLDEARARYAEVTRVLDTSTGRSVVHVT
ncbi:MAG: peptide ligase PGM1-related protein [Actinomycetota bacterium]|nr:peptide ligase PGM1-related protein [Actinomycetota bacterium]